MIEWIQAVVVGIVQGLTEFLPISSSAHLLFIPALFGWPEQGLAFDIVVHVATLLAVFICFRADCFCLLKAVVLNQPSTERLIGWWLLLSPIPLIIATLLLGASTIDALRTVAVIAWSTIIFALFLALAQYRANRCSSTHRSLLFALLVMAFAQAFAIIPGASRSGVTLAAGVLCGLSLPQATRYAFLMAIPTITLAFAYELMHHQISIAGDGPTLLVGFISAFVTAIVCIKAFCRWVSVIGLMPFVFYRLLLGVCLLTLI